MTKLVLQIFLTSSSDHLQCPDMKFEKKSGVTDLLRPRDTESFPVEYIRVWKPYFHRFYQQFTPKNEAGDSYKNNSFILFAWPLKL